MHIEIEIRQMQSILNNIIRVSHWLLFCPDFAQIARERLKLSLPACREEDCHFDPLTDLDKP